MPKILTSIISSAAKLATGLTILSACMILLSSCNKESHSPAQASDDVYVLGSKYVLGSGSALTYWKNGVASPVIGVDNAYGITVSGTDVYIFGSSYTSSTSYVASVSKNGTASQLSSSTGVKISYATDLIVSGADVYICGDEADLGTITHAKYWMNGTGVNLGNGLNQSHAKGIFVSGNDVYVVGQYESNLGWQAVYWKNGVMTTVSDTTKTTYANGNVIVVSNGDVYVGGFEQIGSVTVAKYWKNGVPTSLTDDNTYSNLFDMKVYNNVVYATGWVGNASGFSVATYWENSTPTTLSDGTKNVIGNAIAVSPKGDIYVLERVMSNPYTFYSAILQKNGISISPFLGSDPNINAWAFTLGK